MSVGSSIIGALRVVLGADTAQLDTALKDSASGLKGFGAAAVAAGTLAANAMTAAAKSIADAVTQALGTANKLADLSEALGISVEKLSALKFAADQSGVSLEQLGMGLKTLGQRMVDAIADPKGDAARAFQAIGVSARDAATGGVRNVADAFVDLAGKFQSFQNGAAKLRLADQFGLGEQIPLLNKGKEGIKEYMDEAQRLGLILSTDTAVSAKEFNRGLNDLQHSKEQLVLVVSSRLTPALQQLSSRLGDYARDAANSQEKTALLTGAFKGFVTGVEITVASVATLQAVFSNFWDSIRSKASTEELIARNKKMWEELKAIWSSGAASIDNIWNDWAPTVRKAADETGKAMAPIAESARNMKDRFAEMLADLHSFVGSSSDDFGAKMLAIQDAFRAGNIKARDEIQLTATVTQQAISAQKAALMDLISTPTETLAAKMKAVNQAVADGTINTNEFNKASKTIAEQNIANWEALGTATANALTSIFKDNKAAAIAAAVINTAVAVTKNLSSYPWPFSAIMAGLAAASGAAQIAAIKSQSMSGGGTARAVSTPSGGSAATAAQASQAAAPAAGPPGQTLTVTGIDPRSLFSGEAVRRLAEMLVQHQKNGGSVVFAQR